MLSKLHKVALSYLLFSVSDACKDSEYPVYYGHGCDWVGRFKTNRCNLMNGKNRKLKFLCQVTCDNCSRSVKIGASCFSHRVCISGFCSNRTCQWKIKDGLSCTENIGCKSRKCVNGKCQSQTTSVESKACQKQADCTATEYCSKSICKKRKGINHFCTRRLECLSKLCYNMKCTTLKSNGEGCDVNDQCQSKYCSSGLCKNQNVAIIKSKLGEHCFKNSGCYSNYCTNSKCSKPPKANTGQACSFNIDCKSSLCKTGICANSPKFNGQNCSYDNECISENCVSSVCTTKTTQNTLKINGEECESANDCESNYCSSGICRKQTVFIIKSKVGEPCLNDGGCESGSCVETKCIQRPSELKQNGQTCSNNNDCKSENCVNGLCKIITVMKIDGSSCHINSDCQSDYCNSSGKCSAMLSINVPNGETCNSNEQCKSQNCLSGLCRAVRKGTGRQCTNNTDCISNKCSQGTCLAHDSCEVLGGHSGPFDQKTIVFVFVGSGFADMDQWDSVVNDAFNHVVQVEFFKSPDAKYKALYVREATEEFCDYFCYGVERLLCCEHNIAEVYTDRCFPKNSELQTVVIHNDEKYGGAGYIKSNMAVMSTNPYGKHLLIHELGHSLFNFGDEYVASEDTSLTSANCDTVGCPKWRDLDIALGGGFCEKRGCNKGDYYVGRNSFMKNQGLPIGDVNLRFSCCTYLAYTKTSPSYCRKYDDIGEGLVKYCQNDYQGYGGAEVYENRRRMTEKSLPWWHDDSTSITNANIEQARPLLLSVDVIKQEIILHQLRIGSTDTLFDIKTNLSDFEVVKNVINGKEKLDGNYQIKMSYDTGHTEEFHHHIEKETISVPPLDLFNDTYTDGIPSSILHPNSQIRFTIDGFYGNITKIELTK